AERVVGVQREAGRAGGRGSADRRGGHILGRVEGGRVEEGRGGLLGRVEGRRAVCERAGAEGAANAAAVTRLVALGIDLTVAAERPAVDGRGRRRGGGGGRDDGRRRARCRGGSGGGRRRRRGGGSRGGRRRRCGGGRSSGGRGRCRRGRRRGAALEVEGAVGVAGDGVDDRDLPADLAGAVERRVDVHVEPARLESAHQGVAERGARPAEG